VAEQPNPFCGTKDADIAEITKGKSTLKNLMSGDLSNLDGMEEAQKKMKQGFDSLAGKSTGPVELCVCKYYVEDFLEQDEDFNYIVPTNQADCEAAGGVWSCRTVENFSLQDELGKLGELTDPNAFTAKVADIKAKFANTVPDLSDKVGKVNSSLGEFFSKVQIPELPKVGDQVEQCSCSSPLYSTQEECEAAGETWTCKTVEFKGFGIPGVGELLGGGGIGSGKVSTLGDFASGIQGGVDKVTSFFSSALAGADSGQVQANGAINFGENGKFQMPNLVDKIPKPGELVDTYVCSGGDPLASGKEECLASGGEWKYLGKKAAPDLTNLFGASGLPKLTPENICKFSEKIEVKSQIQTNPTTGAQEVVTKAAIAPEKPVVPKEPPAKSEPAPSTNNDAVSQYSFALIDIAYFFGTFIKNIIKKDKKNGYTTAEIKTHTNIVNYCLREACYDAIGENQDTANHAFWLAELTSFDIAQAEKYYHEYYNVIRPARNPNWPPVTKHKDVQSLADYMWKNAWVKYWTTSTSPSMRTHPLYDGEEGLKKWLRENAAKAEKISRTVPNNSTVQKLESAEEKKPINVEQNAIVETIEPTQKETWPPSGIVTDPFKKFTYDSSKVYKSGRTTFWYFKGRDCKTKDEVRDKGIMLVGTRNQALLDSKIKAIESGQTQFMTYNGHFIAHRYNGKDAVNEWKYWRVGASLSSRELWRKKWEREEWIERGKVWGITEDKFPSDYKK
jgi:hypothetical protein